MSSRSDQLQSAFSLIRRMDFCIGELHGIRWIIAGQRLISELILRLLCNCLVEEKPGDTGGDYKLEDDRLQIEICLGYLSKAI